MSSRRNIFLVIGLLYFLSRLAYYILRNARENAITTPGWQVTLSYDPPYNNWFTPVFFLAAAIIYSSERNQVSKPLFISHVIASVIPVVLITALPLFISADKFNYDEAMFEFQIMEFLELFFIISQAIFITLILIKAKVFSVRKTSERSL
jgi:hypothetical protein